MDFLTLSISTFILAGAVAMVLSAYRTRRILALLKENRYSLYWRVLLLMMLSFVLGYLGVAALVWNGGGAPALVVTGIVFFLAALFVYIVVRVGSMTIGEMQTQSRTISQIMGNMQQTQAELRESEERFRLMSENAVDLISMVDLQGKRLYSTPSFQRILGYSPAELQGTCYLDQILPEDRERVESAANKILEGEPGELIEYRMIHKDGSARAVESISSLVRREKGETDRLLVVSRDVTERNRAREEERETQVLKQQNEYLAALHSTTLGLMSRHELSDLLQAVVARAGALVGTEHGYVFWREEDKPDYEMRVGIGTYASLVGTRTRPGVGLAGRVLATGEPLAVDDYQTWPQRLRDPGRDVLRAVVGVPIKSGDQVAGVLGLAYLDEGRKFGASEIEVLQRFSELASVALDNARLYAAAQTELAERERAEMERRQTENFVESIVDNLPIMLFTKDAQELRFTRWNRAGEELVGFTNAEMIGKNDADFWPAEQAEWFMDNDRKVLESKQLLDIPVEPIQTREKGLRYLHTRKIPIVDSQGTPRYLLGISEDITERREAEDITRRTNAYLTALHETSIALMQRLDSQELLRNIIARAGALVGTEHGYIYLHDSTSGRVEMKVGVGVYEALVGSRLSPGVGLAGKVWETGEALVVDDYQVWPLRLPSANRNMLRAASGVPLKSGETVIGVIGLASLDPAYKFTRAEMQVLNQFAQLAALALDNAQLFENAKRRLEELETLNRLTRTMSSQLDLDTLIQSVGDQVRQLFQVEDCYVALLDKDRNMIEFPYFVSENQPAKPDPLPYGEGLTSRILQTREPLTLMENAESQAAALAAHTYGPPSKSYLGVPIIANDQAFGVLSIQSTTAARAFNESQARLLTTIAGSVAIAIQNARLYQQARARAQREQLTREIVARVSRSIDQSTILQTAARQLGLALGSSHVVVRLQPPASDDAHREGNGDGH
ncbi:MAG: GAF domain-containing protein [Rudaea sp.]